MMENENKMEEMLTITVLVIDQSSKASTKDLSGIRQERGRLDFLAR